MVAAVSLKDSAAGRRQYGRPIGDPPVEVVRPAGGPAAPPPAKVIVEVVGRVAATPHA
jgi:hypothetical protein